jgi:TonB-linked SusC/RagA family outer membrane protein
MIKNLLLSLTFLCSVSLAMAQGDKTVTGKVTDGETGESIPGVNVIAKGTSSGTVTDINGDYNVTLPEGSNVLIYSYVGYTSEEIEVGSQTKIDVKLIPDITALSEIVVVGYGTQEKKEITSAVASIKPEDFNRGNVQDPAQLLQGKVAGLSISTPGGDPNATPVIRLRGLSTVGGNVEPLVVVDGVIGSSLENVDPNDIESIDVLKDGSAAAIYGTRASSGVIMVTTKSGKKGSMKIDYNAYVAGEGIANRVSVMTAEEYRALGDVTTIDDQGYTTNWLDEVTQTGFAQNHNIAFSGGSEKSSYRVSMNYRDQDGILKNSGFDQLGFRANLQQKALNDKLTINVNVAQTRRESNYGFVEGLRYATIHNPTAPIFNDNDPSQGYFEYGLFDIFNPVALIEQNVNEGQWKFTNANIKLDYEIIDNLIITANYGLQTENEQYGSYYSKNAQFRGLNRDGLARRGYNDRYKELFEAYGNWLKDFSNLNISILAGYSFQEESAMGEYMENGDFLSDDFLYHNIESGQDLQEGIATMTSYRDTEHRTIAFFGRVNLNWNEAYFLSASVRHEGDSRFGVNNKWGTFPGISGGANFANLFDTGFFEDLKLRAGYGITGAIPARSLLYLQNYVQRGFAPAPTENLRPTPIYRADLSPNPDLKWEEKREFNIGVDFAFMDGKFSGSLDWYNRQTVDFIQEVNVDASRNPTNRKVLNVGEFRNSGFELSLNHNAYQSTDFTYKHTVILSTYSTELVSFNLETGEQDRSILGSPGQQLTPIIKVREGQPIGQIWGPVFVGVDGDGNPLFKDISGNKLPGEEGYDYCDCDDDKTVIGNGIPDFELGWNNTLIYKNWDLNFFFRGSFGHDLVNTYRVFYEPLVAGQVQTYNRVNTEYFDERITNPLFSDYYVEDASFVTLDNITLGYNFDVSNINAISRLRLYITGQNLFYITNYTGVSPEVRWQDAGASDNGGAPANEFNEDVLAPGIERRNTYFRPFTATFGVNISFN